MSYQTYTTDALVCGTWAKNTADKSYLLFTQVAGMLYADARSVREEKSKQRYALQDFSLIRVSLVRGKQNWRIGSVQALSNPFLQSHSKASRGSVVRLLKFLRRFYNGEEPAPDLFEYIIERLNYLAADVKNRQQIELVTELHILTLLGYVDSSRIPNVVKDGILDSDTVLSTASLQTISRLVEHATNSSQL